MSKFKLKKMKLFFFFIIILTCFAISQFALAQFVLWEIQNVQIKPSNIVGVGGTVTVSFDFYGSPLAIRGQQAVEPFVSFGDGESELGSACIGNPDANSPQKCSYTFTHSYDTPGEYTITINLNAIGVGFGGGGGGTLTSETRRIIVASPPSPTPGPTQNPIMATSVESLLQSITNFVYWIVSALLLVMIALGGLTYLTSAGNPEAVSKANRILFYSLLGFAIMSLARGIIQLVLVLIGRG